MRHKIRQNLMLYLHQKISSGTRRVLTRFFSIKSCASADLELSSESTQGKEGRYARLALTCLRREEVLALFSEAGCSKRKVVPYMFDNEQAPCFGMGIADYGLSRKERRIKLYNYYHLVPAGMDWQAHIRKVCKKARISWARVALDIACFGRARMSAVDLYDDGKTDLKVYFGPFLSTDIVGKWRHLFKPKAVQKYRALLKDKALSRLVLLCVRYGKTGRSVRTDFWYETRRVLPYLKALDPQRHAARLYTDLRSAGAALKLTFICVDLDQRPRTQFYFELKEL
ncbi:MAG: hypothetical protein HQL19_01450 [Candidatus Omnitrophica bacterium]|nr:hypothetical protein [Candidatus Omnitrophota bacterium]